MEPNGGLALDSTYPYNTATSYGHATVCDTTLEAETISGTTPSSYEWATTPCTSVTCNDQDESTLQSNLLSYGPISIACDASEWSSYTSGVLTSSSCSSSALKLDHAIQLVGYNSDASTPYWIVRNSWGEVNSRTRRAALRRIPEIGTCRARRSARASPRRDKRCS